MNKILRICLCCMVTAYCTTAVALPPLGLTSTNLTSGGALEIIDGTAYITAPGGTRTVSSTSELGFISITHPTLGSPIGVTRVVKASDGKLYIAANFGDTANFSIVPALYELAAPNTPVVTWEQGGVSGVDVNLRSLGNVQGTCFGCYAPTYFYVDGSTAEMQFPAGTDSSNNSAPLIDSTPQSFAIGYAGIPMTAGTGPVMWTPNGNISFLNVGIGDATSIRDRMSGGVNIGSHDFNSALIEYGDGRWFYLSNERGQTFYDEFWYLSGYSVTVSHSDFSVVKYWDFRGESFNELYAFYPGIVPGFDNRAMPLLDIFPELATIDIDTVSDLASVDGYIYMTLSGSDGTFLFGARDPSAVPEPPSAGLLLAVSVTLSALLREKDSESCIR